MDVIEAGDVIERPSPEIFRSSRYFSESEIKLIGQIKRNFLDTIGYMEFRKFSRKHQGVFRDVARGWTLAFLLLYSFFSNILFFSTCPNLGDIADSGSFNKGSNLIILCVEISFLVITSFWLIVTQFQTGVVYSFRLSVFFTGFSFLIFILRTTLRTQRFQFIFQKCDYKLWNGDVVVYDFLPLVYLSLQFFIALVSFVYSRMRPIIAVFYFKHPWFLKSWKFVNIEPVELKLLSFGRKSDANRQFQKNETPKSPEGSKAKDAVDHESTFDTRIFWKMEENNQNIRLASGYFIEIKRFSLRRYLKKFNPFRLDLLLTFRTRKDRARRPNSLENHGCSITSWYLGEVNEDGRPHGFGRWREDDYHGEILVGFWRNGHPIGPFKTRECRSGSGFICLKLGFCRTEVNTSPNIYGYADIECSVSGQFFRGFPICHIYPAPTTGVQRSPSIFARIGAKGKAAINDTTQLSKDVIGAVFGRRNLSFFSGKKNKEYSGSKNVSSEENNCDDNNKSVNENNETTSEDKIIEVEISHTKKQNTSCFNKTKNELPKIEDSKQDCGVGQQRGFYVIRKVRQKLRKNQNKQERERDISLLWLFQNLSPHLPMFTIHPKNEITILVDPERGLYIAGYFPVSEVLQYTKQTGAKVALSEEYSDNFLNENSFKSQVFSPKESVTGLIPYSSSFSSSSVVRASQYPLNRQDNRYLESVEVRVVDRYRKDNDLREDDNEQNNQGVDTIYYPELEVKNWVHSDGLHAAEALIFIHGYNNTIVDALRQVGQMIAFGNFPAYIKPMVFSWPSGNSFLEYFIARKNAENPLTHNSLCQLIIGLRNRGIRHIHIMTHSMGTRLFIQSFPKLLSENLLERCEYHDHRVSIAPNDYYGINQSESQAGGCSTQMNTGKVQIVSMTFLNPDYYLDDFINKAFPMLRQYCNLITMYGDSQDGALKWSEIIQGRKSLGCNVFGLHYGPMCEVARIKTQINEFDQYNSSDIELVNTENRSRLDLNRIYTRQENALSLIYPSRVIMSGYNSQSPKQCSPRASNSGILDSSSPYANTKTPEQRFSYLDMDVIDQSFIEQNVGSMRHNNWNLNREVIEDLRELVVSRKRAYQRSTRLDKREGNVWVYRLAPSCVTSIFD
ncbi:hypothetical protein FG386_003144 [Cryptosporidium ryanae]|uniref:uncharacterized protein n=1 Tax=Cryptosporidium ryanae TaxID=515981 RepID=UPI00351A4EF5|nr:hypothetical protein FG386_003144 [Cryptosporidium ryanae]